MMTEKIMQLPTALPPEVWARIERDRVLSYYILAVVVVVMFSPLIRRGKR